MDNLGRMYLNGPGSLNFDVNLIKRINIAEGKSFEMRATAIDVLNHPRWRSPNTDINPTSFGKIPSAGGNRIMVMELRINF